MPRSQKNDQPEDLAAKLAKKKDNESKDSIKLRSITIQRKTGDNEKLYFLLSTFILLVTCLIIIGSIAGLIYFVYASLFKREQYF